MTLAQSVRLATGRCRAAVLAVLPAACATDIAAAPAFRRTVHGPLLVVESGPDTGMGITAELRGREVACRRVPDADPIGFIVFERRGDEMAYGVYGLGLAKNPMGADRPLGGDPIAWPDKDHAQGLAWLLERIVSPADAAALVAQNRDHWFRPGLRVFFVLPGRPEDAAATPGGEAARGALRVADLE